MKHHLNRSLLLAASCALVLTCSACGSHTSEAKGETVISWAQVPDAIQKTVTANANGRPVDKVEMETKDNVTVYEAKVTNKDGSRLIIKADEDGKLLGVTKKSAEVKMSWKHVPKAVQTTILKQDGGKKLDTVCKETVDGVRVYEAKIQQTDGSWLIIKVAKDGKLITTKTKKD